MEQKIIYYSDETKDDFSGTKIKTKHLSPKYKYNPKSPFLAIRKFLIYRVIATPLIRLYNKRVKGITYKNKKCMKGYKRQGCFMYGNHTAYTCDAFNPTYIAFPRRADVMVNEDSLSIKGIRWLVKDLGALPIPQDIHMYNKFYAAIEHNIKHKHWVAIYPEAHIWPYYTGVREFASTSFRYPVKLNAPVFTYTMTFAKRKHSSKPKITVYVDGPFFPDQSLPLKDAMQKLRDEVFAVMKERTEKYSTYEYKYKYVYQPDSKELGGVALREVASDNEQPDNVQPDNVQPDNVQPDSKASESVALSSKAVNHGALSSKMSEGVASGTIKAIKEDKVNKENFG